MTYTQMISAQLRKAQKEMAKLGAISPERSEVDELLEERVKFYHPCAAQMEPIEYALKKGWLLAIVAVGLGRRDWLWANNFPMDRLWPAGTDRAIAISFHPKNTGYAPGLLSTKEEIVVDRSGEFLRILRDGLTQNWYTNGQQRSIERWEMGKQHGHNSTYFENGQLQSSGDWKDGRFHGDRRYYRSNGTLAMGTSYLDGRRNGWSFWVREDGFLASANLYESDVITAQVVYDGYSTLKVGEWFGLPHSPIIGSWKLKIDRVKSVNTA